MNQRGRVKYLLMLVAGIVLYSVCNIGFAQYKKSEVSAPPTIFTGKSNVPDSTGMHYPVKATITPGYDELTSPDRQAIDLKDPSNIKTEVEYDYTTDTYVVRTKVGDREVATPFILSSEAYNNMEVRNSMMDYYRKRNSELFEQKDKTKFNVFDMKFGLGPLEKVFGPGGVQLKTQGSVQVKMGVKSNKTDNPALPASARRKTYFDFDQKYRLQSMLRWATS